MGKKFNRKKRSQKIFIEPLEQRIMLDGAGASTFLDLIDESSQSDNSNKSTHEVKKFKEIKSEDGSKELPFTNVPRDQLKRKQIVFIDKQVPDYEKLAKSFKKSVEIHFIETNEDGFKKIEQTLENGKKYSAIHIIGHGSAGQILFGNALLTNESIENYKSTLSNIGESLTQKGDILFYGCNIAANDKGEALLKKISNITKADIAASNNLTGKGGDWVLENRYGIVETKNAEVVDYEYFLANGISSVSGQGVEKHDATSFWPKGQKDSQERIMITLEKENISSADVSTIDSSRRTSSYFSNVSSSNTINSYLVYLNDNTGSTFKTATFNFEGEILGWYFESKRTIGETWSKKGKTYNNADFAKTGASYPNKKHTSVSQGGRTIETNENDRVTISNNNKSLTMKAKNGNPGDFIRVITKAPEENTAPVARDVTKAVNENSISSQGDIVAPSDDVDGDTLHISSITYIDVNNRYSIQSMAANRNYALNTLYGVLNINSSTGAFTYDASSTSSTYDAGTEGLSANTSSFTRINALDVGDTASETFTYTLSDGTDTDTATITINITGINDDPIAVNDQNTITEGGTITRSSTTSDTKELVDNDTDVDGSDNRTNFKVVVARKGNAERAGATAPTVWNGNFLDQTTRPNATIRGNYGSLTIYYDGSYTYTADSQIAGLGSGDTVSDYFNYLVKDDSGEFEAGIPTDPSPAPYDKNSYGVLQISISGVDDEAVNAAPTVTNDTAYVYEDYVVTAVNGASANDGYSSAPFSSSYAISADSNFNSDHGDHTGDLLANDTDSDGDTLTITAVRPKIFNAPLNLQTAYTDVGASTSVIVNNSNKELGSGGQTVSGSYGTLSIGADGSFSYAATASATDALDLNEIVTDSFEYKVSDGTDIAIGTLTVTVKGINDAPVGVNNTDSVTAGSSITRSNDSEHDVLVDDTDVDGDDSHTNFTIYGISIGGTTGTFSSGSATINGTYGTLTINENGSYSYDTSSNANALALGNGVTASDTFTYSFYDNDGSSKLTGINIHALSNSPTEQATLKITVTGQTPQTTNDTGYIAAGSTLTVADGASANDADTSGDNNDATGDHTGDVLGNDTGTSNTVTAISSSTGEAGTIGSALTGTYGELTINANGSYTYVANNAAQLGATTATDVFTYTVTDSASGGTGTATITITILGSNDAPTATDDTGYINENSTLTVDWDVADNESGTDSDYNNESGDHTGEILLNDEDPEGATITVTSIRHTGGTLAGSAISTNEDADTSTTRTDITASTTYANGSSVTGDYGTLTIGADGSYTYAANSANELDDGDIGTDIFTYTVSDGSLTDTATLTITVEGINDAPVAQDDYGFINENSTLTVSNGDNATTDTTTTNLVSKTLTTGSTTGDLYGTDLKFNDDGTKLYILGRNTNKIFQYSLGTAYDISTINATASAASGVAGVVISDAISNLGNGFIFNNNGSKLFAISGTSINEYSLSTGYDISTLNENASDTFDTSIGGLRGMSFNSDGTKLLINRFHATDSLDVVQFTLGTGYDLSSINYDGGVALDIYNLRGLALSGDGTKMFISNQGNGRIHQYSLATAFSINDGVTYEGEFTTNVASLRGVTFNNDGSKIYYIDMLGNNQIKSYDLGENYRVWNFANSGTTGESTGDLIDTSSSTQTDSDKDGSANLTISAIRTGTEAAGTGTAGAVGSSLTGTYGTLTIQSTGAYTYVANLAATEALDAGDVAIDYFTYTLSDGTATDTAQLTIKVTGVNDAPTTTDDTGYIAEGSTLTVANGGVAVSGTTTGSNSGDILENDTDIDMTADSSGNVTESSDDVLTVTGTVSQNGGTNTSGSSVSSNSQTASVGSAVTGLYGSLTINANGSYSYVANNAEALDVGETVTDVFTFTVTDSQSATTTATLTITVIGVNDLPTSANATVYVNERNTDSSYGERTPSANFIKTFASSDFAFTDADTSDSSLSAVKIVTLPSSGTLTLSGSAVSADQEIATASISGLVYTPTANSESNDSFTFKVSDGTGFSASAYTMTVSNNAAPVVTDKNIETAVISGGGTSTGDVHNFVADSDDADSVLVVTGVAAGNESTNSSIISNGTGVGSAIAGNYGTLNIAANGTYTYTSTVSLSAGASSVTDTFTYTTRDNETNTDENYAYDTGTITFTVIPSLTLVDDTDTVTVGNTVTVNDGATEDVIADDSTSTGTLTVSNISFTNSSDTTTTETVTSGGVTITGLYGQLTIYENGSYTYTPNQNASTALDALETGTDVFTYTATNGTDSGNATLTITITGINDAPTSSDATININENNQTSSAGDRTPSNITYTFSSSDFAFSDSDSGDAITHVKIVTLPTNGDLSDDGTNITSTNYEMAIGDIGDLVYTPDANSESDDTFTFKVKDGTTYSTSADTITISVNAAPTATNYTHGSSVATSATASSNLVLSVANSGVDKIDDSDDESDSSSHVLTITGVASGAESSTIPSGSVGSSVTGTYGSLVLNSNGSYTYTANASNNITYGGTATDVFNYAVQDDEGTTGSAGSNALDVGQLTFTVQAVANVAPTASNGTIYINENNQVSSAGDRTPSNISHTFQASEFSLSDTNEAAGQALNIKIVTLPSSGTLTYDTTNLTSSHVNPGTSTTYTVSKANIGNLVYTPNANSEADDSFTFKAYDGVIDSTSTYTITVSVNAAPNVTDTTVSGTVAAGATSSGDVHDGVADSDDADSALVVTAAKAASEGGSYSTVINLGNNSNLVTAGTTSSNGLSVSGTYGTLVIGADGSYIYTASATNNISYGATATDTFTFSTKDDESNSGSTAYDVGELIFTVGSSVSLTADTDTVNEDATVTVANGATEDVLEDDTSASTVSHIGVASNSLTSISTSQAITGTYGTLTMYATGAYSYVADQTAADALVAGATADDVFYYKAAGATTTLTIEVTGLGPLAANDTGAVNEDATVTGTGTVSGTGVLGNDDNGGSTYESEDSTLRVTQAKPDGGSYTSVASGGSSSIVGTYGTLTLYSTGQYSYTPNNTTAQAITKDATVTETFVYEIKDDADVNASTANLVFTITGLNDDITAVDDTDSVDEGTSVIRDNTSTSSLDYDDTDPDSGNTFATHQITAIKLGGTEGSGTAGAIGEPLKGTYGRLTVFADGSYIYQANNNILDGSGNRIIAGDTVTDTFNYTVSDTDGDTDTAVLIITINGTNEPPVASTDYGEIDVGGSSLSKTPLTGVTSNDADIEGSDLTVNGIRTGGEGDTGTTGNIGSPLTGTYGNITINEDGSYTYELDTTNENLAKIPAGLNFYETFTYTVTDDTGQTSTAEIVIKINGVNDAPTAVDDEATLDLDTSSNLDNLTTSSNFVKANDNDVDLFDNITIDSIRTGQSSDTGTSITVGESFTSTYGNFYINANGGYAYNANDGLVDTLKPGEKIYEYFTYTITDSAGLTATAQLTIEIFGSANHANIELQEQGFQDLVQRASLNGKDPYDLPDRAPSASSNFYEGQFKIAKFNENLKLVDLRAQFKDKDGNYTTFSDGNPDDTLVLQFSVFNDPGIELVRYKGEMKDGSALPDWIKVNPKSGVVVTDIPSNIDLLEFKVIGIDDKNNEFEIAVVIEAGELRQNRELAKEFAGEIDENISVNEYGNVEVQSGDEQTNNETENKSLNGNEVKIKSKKQINEFVKGDVFKPKPYLRDNKYIINLPDEIKDNLEKGIAVLRNGEKAPKWAKVNLNKGELVLDPPKNLKNLDLTIITMDQEGNKISNEIKSKINKRSAERFAKQIEIKEQTKFVSLTDQVGNEKLQFDNYGEDILSRL
ncbi:Ig-like domain-containing protein [Candidatus Pelagibacter sp.]|nr:Ig-like domain-containing protein [Candidatus Pelagibacter sp.]